MSTGNSHPRNSADERRLNNDPDQRNKVRCCVCGMPWDEHPADTICNRHRPITFAGPTEIPPAPDPCRDPDQPTMPPVGHPLDRELAFYRRKLPELLARFPGQWAVIKGETGVLIHPTFDDALKAGYEHFGLNGFLVKQILEHEPVLRGSVAWLAERDHLAGEVARLRTALADAHGESQVLILERDQWKSLAEQAKMRLAVCNVAALGYATGADGEKQGDYCWSESFESVKKLRAEVESLRADNAKLADSLASANERLVLLQDTREAQAASIMKYQGELDASRAEVDRLGRTIDFIS